MLDLGYHLSASPRRARVRPHRLRLLITLVAWLVPATSQALTIKSVSVTVHPVKGDAFAIKGELDARDPAELDLAAAARIVFELDGVTLGLGAADFKRTKTRRTRATASSATRGRARRRPDA